MQLNLIGIVIIAAILGVAWYLNKEQEEEIRNTLILIIGAAIVLGMVIEI